MDRFSCSTLYNSITLSPLQVQRNATDQDVPGSDALFGGLLVLVFVMLVVLSGLRCMCCIMHDTRSMMVSLMFPVVAGKTDFLLENGSAGFH